MLSEGELEELAKEARLLKKFKAGKVGSDNGYIVCQHLKKIFFILLQITREQMEASLDELL